MHWTKFCIILLHVLTLAAWSYPMREHRCMHGALTLENYVSSLYKNASQKLNVLARHPKYVEGNNELQWDLCPTAIFTVYSLL